MEFGFPIIDAVNTPALSSREQWGLESWPSPVKTDSGSLLPPMPPSFRPSLEVFGPDGDPPPADKALLSILVADTSDFALGTDNVTMLSNYAGALQHAVTSAIPRTTMAKNRRAWDLWSRFMSIMKTPPLRPAMGDVGFLRARERFLKGAFILWARFHCTGGPRTKNMVKPATLLGYLYAIRRIHEIHDLNFDVGGNVAAVVKFLCKEYELFHGPESLIPWRREGLSLRDLRMMLDPVKTNGLRLDSKQFPSLEWKTWLGRNLMAALVLSCAGGFRKAELSLAADVVFDATHPSRASLFFIINGVIERCPGAEKLRSMQEGDRAGLIACPCKNDPFGFSFQPFPLFFNFHGSDSANAARVLRDLALFCPIPADRLRATPLLSSSESLDPFRHGFLDMVLKKLLRATMPEDRAALYTWHSFRIGLACSLLAANAPEHVILALCRWRSKASLRLYARLNISATARWIDDAGSAVVNSVQSPNLPRVRRNVSEAISAEIPNALTVDHYAYLQAALIESDKLDGSQMRELASHVPDIDDDDFMRDLKAFTPRKATGAHGQARRESESRFSIANFDVEDDE